MPELEAEIEQKLIEQLVYGDSQWTVSYTHLDVYKRQLLAFP